MILFDEEPDPLESKVRVVCGALLGLTVAFCIWLRFGPMSSAAVVLLFATCVAGCAYGALRYGDSFWHGFLSFFRGL